ncbi:MAG: glucokinase [Beijerinckiaceae bacterium]
MTAFPALLADIGGTNARFSLLAEAGSAPVRLGQTRTGAHRDFACAVRSVLADQPKSPRSACIAAAGPMQDGTIALTNAEWRLEPAAISAELGLSSVMLLNDFEALSLSLAALGPTEWQEIGAACTPLNDAPRIVVGPGTGLGAAALLPADGRWLPVASEAGHVSFGPETAEDDALWPHLERVEGRITAECLISGPGLLRLHVARQRRRGAAALFSSSDALSKAALAGDSEAVDTVLCFMDQLARYAGDMALAFNATGGVYLGGGIMPRLAGLIDHTRFRTAFERRASYTAMLADIPIRLIMATNATEIGLAALASRPERFLMRGH